MDPAAPLQLQVMTLDYSEYLGRIAIGRIYGGNIKRGMQAVCCRRDGSQTQFRVTKLMGFLGLQRIDRDEATAGEIVALAGVDDVTVGETICAAETPAPMTLIPIDEPTIAMMIGINTSPFAGQEGARHQPPRAQERLKRELERNVGLRLEEAPRSDFWRLLGRGTLHLSVLIENMRREGYELGVGQPQVVLRETTDRSPSPTSSSRSSVEELAGLDRAGTRRAPPRAGTWSRTARVGCAWTTRSRRAA